MSRFPLMLALFLAGCPAPKPVMRPYPGPKPDELVHSIEGRARAIRTMRADAKVDYMAGKGERVKLSMGLLVEAPDHLHMDAESAFVGSVASLTTDGQTFQFLDVRNNRFLAGEAAPCAIAQLIRLELRPATVVAVLVGGAPLLDGATWTEVGWDETRGGREVLTQKNAAGEVETIKLSSKDRLWDMVEAERRGPDGKVMWRVEHEEFELVDGQRLPRKTTITQPTRDADTRIRFRSRELNVPVPPGAFHLAPPPGLAVEGVGCPSP